MVEATANFLLATLRDLLIEEVKFVSSVKYEVKKVEEDLKTIHALLKDADANKSRADSATFQNFIIKLKELAFDAENVLDTYAVEVQSKRGVKGLKKMLQRYMGILCECCNVHEVGNAIEGIRSRLADLTAEQSPIAGGGDGSSDSADQEHMLRLRYAHEVDRHFVGMKKEIDSLVSMVQDDSPHSPSVISICGMGGLGKTTLARKIYHHQDIQGRFDSRAWVCLTQQFRAESILSEIIKQIDGNKPNEGQTLRELVQRLYNVLVQRKCLIVMDDIWEDDHLKMIEAAFPKENCKVVLTTRFQDIASHHERHLHMLGLLSEDEGWELLGKIALTINLDGTKGNCKLDDPCIFPSYTQGQGMYQNLVQLQMLSIDPSKMIFCANSFPQLKILSLRYLKGLREWEVERGAMPRLTELTITDCYYLESLPDEFFSISTIEKVIFEDMSEEFNTHARQAKHRLPNLTVFEINFVSQI